ncbi:MAG TPA: glutamate racemase [bacterium]
MKDITKWSIGIFDSGIGGITVLRAIRRLLPDENIVYLGDTARVPYGNRSPDTILRYSRENTRFLMEKGIKILVVACNTSSSIALDYLRATLPVSVVGVVEPAAAKAVSLSKTGRIGVIGTAATIRSMAYLKAIKRLRKRTTVISKACPLFVPLVEEGFIDGRVTYLIAEKYLNELKKKDLDVLILGCTHYPLLTKVIQNVIGAGVKLVDSGEEAAGIVEGILAGEGILNKGKKGRIDYYVTDSTNNFKTLGKTFFGSKINGVKTIDIL